MKSKTVQHMTMAALFGAIICLTTAYLFHIPIGTAGGYVHLGDAFIYLAGAFLPTPYAMAAAGIGSGLADLLTGTPHWVIFTVIIKAAMAACFTSSKATVLCRRNVVAGGVAGVICLVGYYIAEVILFGNGITPLASMLSGGLFQSCAAIPVFLLCGAALDRAKVKTRLMQ